MSKHNFTEEEIKSFKTDVQKVSSHIAKSVTKLLLGKEKIAIEGLVFGLLKVAGFLANDANCPQHVFEKLATIAYKEEAKASENLKLESLLKRKKDSGLN